MGFRFVNIYNLASFRSRVDVQAFFGRPIDRTRLQPGLTSCESLACLRLTVVKGSGDVWLVDGTESAELKIDGFAVDGLVLD
jgi:hypothetical protein